MELQAVLSMQVTPPGCGGLLSSQSFQTCEYYYGNVVMAKETLDVSGIHSHGIAVFEKHKLPIVVLKPVQLIQGFIQRIQSRLGKL